DPERLRPRRSCRQGRWLQRHLSRRTPLPRNRPSCSSAERTGPRATLRRVPSSKPLLTAELLSVGSELTTGETRDTNAGELAAWGETVAVDPELETWLRRLWDRRGLPFLEINLKQAWLIRSATAIPNEQGTAPGWWVDRPDGRLIVALPGPPREMRPMWSGWV